MKSNTPIELLMEYCWAHDIEDAELLVSCYVPDGQITVRRKGQEAKVTKGPDAMKAMYQAVFNSMLGTRRHIVTNILVENETATEATVRSYLLVTEARKNNEVVNFCAGWQRDEFVKTAQGWRLKTKFIEMDGPYDR